MKKFKGFTIIEIVIVVSIIGTLALIVSPNYIKNIRYVRQQEALNLGRQICLCIVNSEIMNEEYTVANEQIVNVENIKKNAANEINNFTKINVSKNNISIEGTEELWINYEKYNKRYKAVVNMYNCKYKIYMINGESEQLVYDDYEM